MADKRIPTPNDVRRLLGKDPDEVLRWVDIGRIGRDGLASLREAEAVYTVNRTGECLLVGWSNNVERRIRCFWAVLLSNGAGIRMPKAAALRESDVPLLDLSFEVYFSEAAASGAYRVRTNLRPRFNQQQKAEEPKVEAQCRAVDVLNLLTQIRGTR